MSSINIAISSRFLVLLWSALILIGINLPTVSAVERITSQEMYEGILSGRWDVIIDTRREDEWDEGHIMNATFLDSLQNYQINGQTATPDDLAGCKDSCTIVVYCRSGFRSQAAAAILEEAGFAKPVYNGLGINQWIDAGYELTNTPSQVPPCTLTREGICTGPLPDAPTPQPTTSASSSITVTLQHASGVDSVLVGFMMLISCILAMTV